MFKKYVLPWPGTRLQPLLHTPRCRFDPPSGRIQESTNECKNKFSDWSILPFSFPLSKNQSISLKSSCWLNSNFSQSPPILCPLKCNYFSQEAQWRWLTAGLPFASGPLKSCVRVQATEPNPFTNQGGAAQVEPFRLLRVILRVHELLALDPIPRTRWAPTLKLSTNFHLLLSYLRGITPGMFSFMPPHPK